MKRARARVPATERMDDSVELLDGPCRGRWQGSSWRLRLFRPSGQQDPEIWVKE